MMNEPYNLPYERLYKTVYEAGADHWGHTPDNEVLNSAKKPIRKESVSAFLSVL